MKWTKTLVLSAVALLALVVALTLGTASAWALGGGSETAWGNGQAFQGANWAMYIPVTL